MTSTTSLTKREASEGQAVNPTFCKSLKSLISSPTKATSVSSIPKSTQSSSAFFNLSLTPKKV